MATLGTFVDGNNIDASELNGIGTWVAWTPSWTNLSVGNGVVVARALQLNRIVFMNIELTLGTTSSISGNVGVSSVPGVDPTRVSCMTVTYEDQGSRYYVGTAANFATLTRFDLFHNESTNQGQVNATSPHTWGFNDDILISGYYIL